GPVPNVRGPPSAARSFVGARADVGRADGRARRSDRRVRQTIRSDGGTHGRHRHFSGRSRAGEGIPARCVSGGAVRADQRSQCAKSGCLGSRRRIGARFEGARLSMDETQVKLVIEAALLAAGRPLPLETLASLFASKTSELDKDTLKRALEALAEDYRDRGLEVKEVASGYRIQIKSSMSDWLTPLWEERAPRYTRALLETLALIAYRQPITRAEIEEVRGVAVSTNIIRTLMERNWIRVVGHRDVPGNPAMFG